MDCELCDKTDPDIIVILPIHRSNGDMITMACEECAMNSTAFCRHHGQIHIGFTDGTTACQNCIEELVAGFRGRAEETHRRLMTALSPDSAASLEEMAEMNSKISGSSIPMSVIRFLAAKAARTNTTIDNVIESVIGADSVRFLF